MFEQPNLDVVPGICVVYQVLPWPQRARVVELKVPVNMVVIKNVEVDCATCNLIDIFLITLDHNLRWIPSYLCYSWGFARKRSQPFSCMPSTKKGSIWLHF